MSELTSDRMMELINKKVDGLATPAELQELQVGLQDHPELQEELHMFDARPSQPPWHCMYTLQSNALHEMQSYQADGNGSRINDGNRPLMSAATFAHLNFLPECLKEVL